MKACRGDQQGRNSIYTTLGSRAGFIQGKRGIYAGSRGQRGFIQLEGLGGDLCKVRALGELSFKVPPLFLSLVLLQSDLVAPDAKSDFCV